MSMTSALAGVAVPHTQDVTPPTPEPGTDVRAVSVPARPPDGDAHE